MVATVNITNSQTASQLQKHTKNYEKTFLADNLNYQQIRQANPWQSSYRKKSLEYAFDVFGLPKTHLSYPMYEALFNAHKDWLHYQSFSLPKNATVPLFFTGYAMSLNMQIVNYGLLVIATKGDIDGNLEFCSSITKQSAGAPAVFKSLDELLNNYKGFLGNIAYLGWSDHLGGIQIVKKVN